MRVGMAFEQPLELDPEQLRRSVLEAHRGHVGLGRRRSRAARPAPGRAGRLAAACSATAGGESSAHVVRRYPRGLTVQAVARDRGAPRRRQAVRTSGLPDILARCPGVSTDQLAASRQRILDGARPCFSRHGYEGATVRRLEQATGLSRGAIFHHFRDKDALFLALAEQDTQRMVDVVAEQGLVQVMRELLASPDPLEAGWTGTFLEVARRGRTDPGFRDRWRDRSAALTAAIRERLERQVRRGGAAHRRAGRGAGQLPGAGAGRAAGPAGHRPTDLR